MNVYSKREQFGWCMYDFANSAFYTTVITLFLGPYLTALASNAADAGGYVHPLGIPILAKAFWSFAVALSVILQVIFLPVFGAVADYGRHKKEFLGTTAYLGAVATIGMFFLKGGDYLMGGLLFLIANVAFGAAEVVYNSFLPEIAPPEDRDAVSSKGYAIGYIGGGVLLALNLALFLGAGKIGITEGMAVRISLSSAGAWWAVFTIPTLLTLHNRGPARSLGVGQSAVVTAARQLAHTIKEVRHYPETTIFLVAYMLYNDAIQTVISLSSQFGADELKIPQAQLTLTILMVQFVAFFGAMGFNWVASKTTAKRAVVVSLLVWTAVVIYMFWVTTMIEFFLMAAVVALVLGGSQALSRSLFAQLIPKGREAEYFGVYEITDKGTSWLCPIIFGLALQFTKSFRMAILSLVVFFLAGTLTLLKVDVEQGERDVERQAAA
ncbi:MAG TPA: MFS transporter [Bryobacteraceae bacterium]|nr:MFS transporter [Bryobacteraceae bacterium]